MRTLTLALTAAAALGLATSAMAQSNTMTFAPSTMQPEPAPQGSGGSYGMNIHGDGADGRYDLAIMMLKKKMDRETREDGGKLTPEHAASLQAELDQVNVRYGLKAQPVRRASFGHHEAAPGPSSSSSAGSD